MLIYACCLLIFFNFRIANVVLTAFRLCMMLSAFDFIMPLLAIHMEDLKNYSPVLVGTMFGIMAAGYTLSNPFLGFFTKTRVS